MPRRRDEKSAAPSPSPRLSRRRAEEARAEAERASAAPAVQPVLESADEEEAAEEDAEEEEAAEAEPEVEAEEEAVEAKKPTFEERQAKLKELRMRLNQSSADNRRDLIADHQKSKVTAKELHRLEKQRKLAQTLREKADATENGTDLERTKAWKWSIEQNEQWEKKKQEAESRSDMRFHDANDDAAKKYDRSIRNTKVDLVGYNRKKEAALGLAPGTLVPLGTTSDQLAAAGPSRATNPGLSASEDLYRDKDTLSYGDSKPSEDAVDRVIGNINEGMSKKRRNRKVEETEVNYINKRNKHFNKKAARYFDKYTTEIRANLERGTAL